MTEVLGNDKDGVTGARLKSTVDSATEELAATGVFLAIGHTPNTDFLGGQLQLDPAGLRRLDEAAANVHERRRSLRGRRRGRQLLSAGGDRRRDAAAWRRSTPNAGSRKKGIFRTASRIP